MVPVACGSDSTPSSGSPDAAGAPDSASTAAPDSRALRTRQTRPAMAPLAARRMYVHRAAVALEFPTTVADPSIRPARASSRASKQTEARTALATPHAKHRRRGPSIALPQPSRKPSRARQDGLPTIFSGSTELGPSAENVSETSHFIRGKAPVVPARLAVRDSSRLCSAYGRASYARPRASPRSLRAVGVDVEVATDDRGGGRAAAMTETSGRWETPGR